MDRGNGYLGHTVNRSRLLTTVGMRKRDESKVTWRMLDVFQEQGPQERNRRLERTDDVWFLDILKC